MHKQTVLTLQMAIFFVFVFVTFGVLIIHEKGNLILYPQLEKKLTSYFNSHYSSIQNEVTPSELKFNFKEKTYFYIYQNNKNKKLSFQLSYTKDKKIKSTYQQDYVEGKSFLNSLCEEFKKDFKKILKEETLSTIKVENIKTFKDLKTTEKENLLKKKERKKVPFYEVHFSVALLDLNAKEMTEKIQNVDSLLKENGYHPLSYQIKFTRQDDGTKGFLLKNVTREVLLSGKLENIINTLYQNEETKDDNTQIEMEELK